MFNLILSKYIYFIYLFIVFHSTFRNISAISWRPVLVVEEAGVPEKNPVMRGEHRSLLSSFKLSFISKERGIS
jgi:hypothetical protein